jgi:hypothetical protein
MTESDKWFYLGLLGVAAAMNTGSGMGIIAIAFYSVYIHDYAPRQEVMAQALRARVLKEDSKEKEELRVLREELRLMKSGAEGKEKVQALDEKMRQLEQKMESMTGGEGGKGTTAVGEEEEKEGK